MGQRHTVDYRHVTPTSVTEAVYTALAEVDALVEAVIEDRDRTYHATLGRLEAAGILLDDVTGRAAFLGHVHPDADVRDAGHTAEERIEKSRVSIRDSADVAAAIRRHAATPAAQELTGDRRVVLERWARDIRRAGHDLPAAAHAEVQRLRMRIVELEVAFARNVEAERPSVEITPDELGTLPSALAERVDRDADGRLVLPFDLSTVAAFLEDAPIRALRERIERRWLSWAAEANRPVLEEILAARRRAAALLGYRSWAAYRTETRMAGDAESVDRLIAMVAGPLRELARSELAEMAEHLRADEPGTDPPTVQDWDWRYYDAVRRRELGVDPRLLSEHLPLDGVLSGLFGLVEDVFGVRVTEVDDANGWHADVRRFVLSDRTSDAILGEFLFDPYPRDGKDPGAFAWPLLSGRRGADGVWIPAVVALVTNVTPPASTAPSLLRHSEVETIFHEFGHVLDGILTRFDRPWFAWDWLPLDWAEAPSQILEHWTWDPTVLRRFARHHRTGGGPQRRAGHLL